MPQSTEPSRFFRYDPTELRAVGARFVRELSAVSSPLASDPEVWTELTLDFWCAVAAPGARVDACGARPHLTAEIYASASWAPPRAMARSGPFMLAHSTHPLFEEGHPYGYAYWDRAFSQERLEMLLAGACEWGSGGRPGARYGRVMSAASDLTPLDARVKVIFFATDSEEEHRRIVRGLEQLRLASWDSRPWLWVDVPWRCDWNEHAPRLGVLEG